MKTTKHGAKPNGMQRLLREGRKRFRVPENLNHYTAEDLALAERKFLKACIVLGKCKL